MDNDLVLFKDGQFELNVTVTPEKDTVWLSANQMALLFDKDEKTIRRHINNVFSDNEVEKNNNTQKMRVVGGIIRSPNCRKICDSSKYYDTSYYEFSTLVTKTPPPCWNTMRENIIAPHL